MCKYNWPSYSEDARPCLEEENDECMNIEDTFFTYPEIVSLGYRLMQKGTLEL